MRSLFTALTLSALTLSACATTKQEIKSLVERLKTGELGANALLYSTADRRVAFAHINAWMPTRPLFPSDNPYELTTEIDHGLERVSYQVGGEPFTVSDFLKREPLMGLAVVEGDAIKLEHYADDHTPESVWVSFSVTKSFTSTLIGAAVKDGFIGSIDDTVETYLPRLEGTAYGTVSIKNILQMSSGVAWNENYADPDSDVAKAGT